MNKLLVIKLRYLGDVLLCTPVLRALRQNYPHAQLVCLVNPGTEEILRGNPDIDEILLLPRTVGLSQVRFFREIRSRGFDCVLDLTDGDRSALITAMTGASMRIGFNHENRWRGALYSHCIRENPDSMHRIEYHGKALSILGVQGELEPPQLCVSAKDEEAALRLLEEARLTSQGWVMIHPTARYWFKAWPPERFAELCDRLAQKPLSVILVGNHNDREVGAQIQRLAEHKPISLMGRTRVLELAALMKHCSLFIGNDGGPMHMAAAAGCPVLALFGPTDPVVWGPKGQQISVVYKGLDCRECFHPGCSRGEESCMRQISVEEVWSAALRMLAKVQVLSL